MSDYFDGLPPEDQEVLADLATNYRAFLPRVKWDGPIPDAASRKELLDWQRLEIHVLDLHAAWLEEAKGAVERAGREWNYQNMRRYDLGERE